MPAAAEHKNIPMQLNKTEKKYTDIIAKYIIDKSKTQQQLADEYGIDITTVNRAIKWGNDNGIISALAGQELPKHIRTAQKELKWLDKQRNRIEEHAETEGRPLTPGEIKAISQEIREWTKIYMELTGARAAITVDHKHELSLSPAVQSMLDRIYSNGDNGDTTINAEYKVVHDDTEINYDTIQRRDKRRLSKAIPYNGEKNTS